MLIRRTLAGIAFFGLVAASPAPLVYPSTPVHPVVDHYFGHAVVDPYRWLENPNAPAVRAWAAKQSALTLNYLHAQPSYPVYAKRVAILAHTSTARFRLQIAGGHDLYLRQTPPQPQAQLVVRDGIHGAERVLFDPQTVAAAGSAPPAIESIFLSFDGSKAAFTTQQGGAEEETLHVVETATGTTLPDTIEHVGGGTSPVALVWDGDGNGFMHTQWPQKADGTVADSHIEIWHHTLGSDASSDTYVFGRGLSGRAEYHLLGSRDGKYQAVFETDGDGVHGSIHEIIVGYTGYGTPSNWLRYDAANNMLAPTGIKGKAPGDYSKLIVRRALVPSLDGRVKVPVEIVALPGTKTNGTAPTILSAYGAYGIVTQPFFIGSLLAFLERGGVFAQAMIRGGGEYGEVWHTAAKLATKTKCSDDLAAVAAWMGNNGYGNEKHIGIVGGSAGGFLMGLAFTRNPDHYRAVESGRADDDRRKRSARRPLQLTQDDRALAGGIILALSDSAVAESGPRARHRQLVRATCCRHHGHADVVREPVAQRAISLQELLTSNAPKKAASILTIDAMNRR